MISENIIQEAVERLKHAAPAATIILFGSHARGDARDGSDLDILVVEPLVTARRREMVRLSDTLRPLGIPVDILVTSQHTFQEWAEIPGTILHKVAREGKVLYAAPKTDDVVVKQSGSG